MPKFCKDCKWYECYFYTYLAKCNRVLNVTNNVIDGEPKYTIVDRFCFEERAEEENKKLDKMLEEANPGYTRCGYEGKHFEKRKTLWDKTKSMFGR